MLNKLAVYFIFIFIISISTATGFSDVLQLDLTTNHPKTVNIKSLIDDSNLRDPNGCVPGSIHDYFTEKIVLENKGKKTIENIALIFNDRNFDNFPRLKKYLRLDNQKTANALKIYNFWKEARFHASSEHILARNPFLMLSFWGYTLCYHDTASLMNLFSYLDIPSRVVGRNNHTFAEFNLGPNWAIIDGDLNNIYLDWDNRRLIGIETLLKDPLLALRTKTGGKYTPYNMTLAQRNTARFEYIAKNYDSSSTIIMKKDVFDYKEMNITSFKWDLYPGERILFYPDKPPENAIGRSNLDIWPNAKDFGLGLIEHQINMQQRLALNKTQSPPQISMRYPIVKIVNQSTGEINQIPPKALTLTFFMNTVRPISVFSQCSKIAMPRLKKGQNKITLISSTDNAEVSLAIHYKPFNNPEALPVVTIKDTPEVFSGVSPHFTITCDKRGEQTWWQISPSPTFALVPPNFEQIEDYSPTIRLPKLSQTFFSNKTPYYLRVKVKATGIWSDWSKAFRFMVQKPQRPEKVRFRLLADQKIELQWRTSKDKTVEYMVFGSNRLDFLPEIYAARQITAMGARTISQPNRNLIATTHRNTVTFDHKYVFYRIVAHKAGRHSVPSDLICTYDFINKTPAYLEKPYTLQLRAVTLRGKQYQNGSKDTEKAELMEIKHLGP